MTFLRKSTKAIFILLLTLPLVLWALSVGAEVFDKVVAKVNSAIITLSSVEERADLLRQKYAATPARMSGQELLREALNMIIDEKLQIQAGKKYGFVVDEDAVSAAVDEIKHNNSISDEQLQEMLLREGRSLKSYKDHIRDQIMVSKISRFELGNRVKISAKSIVTYYKKHQNDFWKDGQVRARHILFIAERGSSEKIRNEKLQLAKKVLQEIQKGKDFAELAKKYSEDISASSGGDVGFVTKGKMVREFEDAVFSLKAGQISGVVETEYGYHIIKVEEVLPGETLTLKEVKEPITQILTLEKQKQVYDDWMGELRSSAFIEVTLFKEPGQNEALVSGTLAKETNDKGLNNITKSRSKVDSKKEDLQKKWIEMYKSVGKSRNSSKTEKDSEPESMEQQLKHVEQLRKQEKISKQEYQKRKEMILQGL
jgi:peptidyl-prolyl cis-trans isomerase SurA